MLDADADTLLLDRDGTINVRIVGDYVRNPRQLEFLPGILEEMPLWAQKFRHIIVVTNQRGVGKGIMTDADLAEVHKYLLVCVQAAGGRIDAILTCTSVSDDDPRRKPNPGMYHEARMLFPDIKKAVMAGDSHYDRDFALNAGIPFILL
ncbi:MAG: HAD-IIIA family hydrolase [Bacteroidales bacterium]|nr:HAD-IIIA family hydrolase [Bacteroidales bacterium]